MGQTLHGPKAPTKPYQTHSLESLLTSRTLSFLHLLIPFRYERKATRTWECGGPDEVSDEKAEDKIADLSIIS